MDLILLMGQSNAKGCGNPEGSEVAGEYAYEYMENFTGNTCIPLGRTLQFSEGRGTVAPALARRYHELMGEKVCIIHYAVDGSRIKNWVHDTNQFLEKAICKFLHAADYTGKREKIGKRLAVWIQGESDAKYGTDPLYYREKLLEIGRIVKQRCEIPHTFVSRVGYWMENEESQKRSEWIGAAQESACQMGDSLILVSRMASQFPEQGLLQDAVHYNMKALNLLGRDIAEHMAVYLQTGRLPEYPEAAELKQAMEFLKKLEEWEA